MEAASFRELFPPLEARSHRCFKPVHEGLQLPTISLFSGVGGLELGCRQRGTWIDFWAVLGLKPELALKVLHGAGIRGGLCFDHCSCVRMRWRPRSIAEQCCGSGWRRAGCLLARSSLTLMSTSLRLRSCSELAESARGSRVKHLCFVNFIQFSSVPLV